MTQRVCLLDLIETEMAIAPGVYDCITAFAVERAGFKSLYMTGAGTAAALGYPDFGLTTMTELAENAGRISAAVGIPLIADADTGFGNELNVVRTVQEYERRGVAAIQLEDQVFPKRCGHLDGKEITPIDEFLSKIRAAVASRRSPDFAVIARTDAIAVAGFDEAIARARAAASAGADIVFIEAPQTMEQIERVPSLVDAPCLFNLHYGGKTPPVSLEALRGFGYRIVIVPGLILKSVMNIADQKLLELLETRMHPVPVRETTVQETFRQLGSDRWNALRTAFSGRE